MPKLFDELREKLLSAGIAPRHVRRYLAELNDHLADLRAGTSSETEALTRLGTVAELAKPLLAKPELRSLAARFPRTVYGLAPITFWLGLTIAMFLLIVSLADHDVILRRGGDPRWASHVISAALLVCFRILPFLLAASAVISAIRQRLSLISPGVGVWIILVMSYTFTFSFTASTDPSQHSEIMFTSSLLPFLVPFTDAVGPRNVSALVPGLVRAIATFAGLMAVTVAWRQWAVSRRSAEA